MTHRPRFSVATLVRIGSGAAAILAIVLLVRALPVDRLLLLVQAWTDGAGVWAPLVYGVVYVAAALAFVPGSVLTLGAGATFGLATGVVVVWVAATTAAAAAFLIARYIAREAVQRRLARSPRLVAIDTAIGEQGWRLVALLRLAPVVPFNLQNYLYGVTAIRFWPAMLSSGVAMLPGTVVYVYLGTLGRDLASGQATTPAQWALRGIGVAAAIGVTVYITRLARAAIDRHTALPAPAEPATASAASDDRNSGAASRRLVAMAAAAAVVLALSALAFTQRDRIRAWTDRMLGLPPMVTSVEAYEPGRRTPVFDHTTLDRLLHTHVDAEGRVDYAGLLAHSDTLRDYEAQLDAAPFADLGRDEKLALLINAYNAFTLRLILDHYPIGSILDIPEDQRWRAVRWRVGGRLWSLDQIEHEEIRPKFREPRIHFALVCAAVGCPPLRNEAYVGTRLEAQLDAQAHRVHADPRWIRLDAGAATVQLTRLYEWYGGDFTQYAPSVVRYAARYTPALQPLLDRDTRVRTAWLEYDWSLNDAK